MPSGCQWFALSIRMAAGWHTFAFGLVSKLQGLYGGLSRNCSSEASDSHVPPDPGTDERDPSVARWFVRARSGAKGTAWPLVLRSGDATGTGRGGLARRPATALLLGLALFAVGHPRSGRPPPSARIRCGVRSSAPSWPASGRADRSAQVRCSSHPGRCGRSGERGHGARYAAAS